MDKITAEVIRASLHELKGPVARLPLLAQLLARRFPQLDPDTQRLFQHLQSSASEAGAAVDALSTYLEVCSRPLQPAPVDLSVLLAAAVSKLKSRIDKAGAQVTHSGLPVVHGDAFLIGWLLEELLSNALRHGSTGNLHVHVSGCTDPEGQSCVAVSDNGRGIEDGQEERIFRPFVAVGDQRGTGLGLAICRQIADLHHGRCWLHRANPGAEFRFSLPPLR